MTPQNKNVVRQRLLDKLDDLTRKDARDDLVRDRAHCPWDQIQNRIEMDLAISVINKDWETRKSVERALKMLAYDEYGICEECGDEINAKRLEAIPWTTLCVACQEDQDGTDAKALPASYRHAA